ncbi:hypothetical protein J6V85_04675 [Candidatus Saccharibacteria bacterium]|nr:hypothetical protein [Candidatus Saccharibacteria bacterium]
MSSSAAILRSYDKAALDNSQFISSVSGRKLVLKKGGKLKAFGAAGFITAMIAVFAILFGTGNLVPSAISERLIEETDIQYADAVKSKEFVFQQAMFNGEIPEDTKQILEQNGVEVISADNGEVALKMEDKIITASSFISEVNSNVELYNAFTAATYGRAAYYYDESAEKVFRKIGTNRDNYTSKSSFDEVMSAKVGEGSDINVNSVSLVKKTRANEETGEEEVYYEYEENGPSANSNSPAGQFINEVREKNPALTALDSALYTADALKVADTISKEERSSLFFVTFMENISKMKAGDGNESKINEAMNFLYESADTEILDVETGEMVKSSGTALESPSLYAVLAGTKLKAEDVKNYSSDRILKTVENRAGVNNSGATISETVASSQKMKGSIGRFISSGLETASAALLNILEPTVSNSLMENSYDTIKGIDAGEFLVEGAVNVGKELAKASGASAGDTNAVNQYARLNNKILAMDAAADRLNRSPFDISSRNTFLGSIIYNFAISLQKTKGSLLSSASTILSTTKSATLSLLPTAYAAEESEGYLTTFGECETYGTIGAVGSAHCSEIATFDTSTLNDPFNDPGFIEFVNSNTSIGSNGERIVNKGSALARYILYNNERETPLGVVDGGILESLKQGSSISFISNILAMIKTFLGTTREERRIASGEAFVNSSANPDWQVYKYAQRYVSLARATSALKQYSKGSTAYNNIRFFEGNENPVVAFLNEYYLLADN